MVEIISVHIDKTAGMLFCDVLKQVYGSSQVHVIWKGQATYQFENKLKEPIPPQTRVIHGAFPVSHYEGRFIDAKRIIWVRNPIERLISYYFYILGHHLVFPNGLEEMSLLEFAAPPQICNQMLRMIGSLEKFYFVGTQEFMLDDLYQLRDLLQWPAFEIKSINTNPFPNYQEKKKVILGNRQLISQLESLNKEDIKLYQDGLKLRENRLKTSRLRNQ
jgi:hypothetical protein